MKATALALCVVLGSGEPSQVPSALGQLAAQMRAGTWAELKTEGLNMKVFSDGSHHALEYTDEAVWDPVSRQLLFSGEGHGGPNRFVKYSESSNQWTVLPLPDFADRKDWGFVHAYDHQAVDAASGTYYRTIYNKAIIHQYEPKTGVWSKLADIPEEYGPRRHITKGFEYFPEMQGLVVFFSGSGVYFYHLPKKEWRVIATKVGQYAYHEIARYNPVHKVVVLGGGNDSTGYVSKELWKLDPAGKLTPLASAPIPFGINQTIFTVDPVSGKYLLLSRDKSFHEYDVVANSWSPAKGDKPPFFDLGGPGGPTFGCVAAPVSAHGVVLFVRYDGDKSKVYVYKHTEGTKQRR